MTVTTGTAEQAAADARAIVARGIRTIKVKVGSGDLALDIARVQAIAEVSPKSPIIIDGNAGNDIIKAGQGDDIVYMGDGNDRVTLGNGNNSLYGETTNVDSDDGDDNVTAGSGNNFIAPGTGDDKVKTGNGNNTVIGGSGDDKITTGSGDDIIDADGYYADDGEGGDGQAEEDLAHAPAELARQVRRDDAQGVEGQRRQAQPDAGSSVLIARCIKPRERTQGFLAPVSGNAGTIVLDRDAQAALLEDDAQLDPGCKAQCVRHQVFQGPVIQSINVVVI